MILLFRHPTTDLADIQELLREHKHKCMKTDDPKEIIVRRTKLLESTFYAVKSKTFDCCQQLLVQFSGEDAIDAGGPRREFFRYSITKVLIVCGGCIFIYSGSAQLTFFDIICY